MSEAKNCSICPPGVDCQNGDFSGPCNISGTANCNSFAGTCACNCPCSAPAESRWLHVSTFTRRWRAFVDALPETAEQAAKLLPNVEFSDAPAFVSGYKRGVRGYCHQVDRVAPGIIPLDACASISTPAGYLSGIQRGAHDCTIAFGHLLGVNQIPS